MRHLERSLAERASRARGSLESNPRETSPYLGRTRLLPNADLYGRNGRWRLVSRGGSDHSQTETVWPVPASPGWAREPQENERAKAKDKELEGVAQLSMRLAWHGLVFWAASARVDRGKKRRGKREREPTGVCLPPTWSSPRGDPGLIRSIFASHRTSLRSPIPKPCFFVPLFF